MNDDGMIETRLIQPGRPTGVYELSDDGHLCLKEIVVPEVSMPFDVAVLPNTLTDNGENLHVILIGEISHPPHTRITIRIIGGIQWDGTEPYLLGVPVADHLFARPDTCRHGHRCSDQMDARSTRFDAFINSSTKPG